MHKNAKLQMLGVARFSQFDGAQFWIVLFIVTAILSEIAWVVLLFVTKQCVPSFGTFCSFRNDICIFLILNPKKQTEQRFYESSGVQGFRLDLKVFKGRREHLHTKKSIHRLSFCLKFLKIPAKALLNIQLWLLDLTPVHLYQPDIVNARRWYFLVHAVTSKSDCWIDSTLLY